MKKLIITILFIIYSSSTFSQQNLVINPSFEDHILWDFPYPFCDTLALSLNSYNPTSASPNYHNTNSCYMQGVPYNPYGIQYPYDGDSYYSNMIYVALDSNTGGYYLFREYVTLKLLNPLDSGIRYCVKFYVSLTDSSAYATDKIQALFSDTLINYTTIGIIPLSPQIENDSGRFLTDSKGWMKVSGSFIAHGGESYITIGNFYDDQHSDSLRVKGPEHFPIGQYDIYMCALYYIDMVSVIECDNPPLMANAGYDRQICTGDSTRIGTYDNPNYVYHWEPAAGLSNPDTARPLAFPQQTTTYTLTQTYYDFPATTDEITVNVKPCSEVPVLIVYPNPGNGIVNFKVINGLFENATIELWDIMGRQLLRQCVVYGSEFSINISAYSQGAYMYRVYDSSRLFGTGKIILCD